jgi:hypothetical protein
MTLSSPCHSERSEESAAWNTTGNVGRFEEIPRRVAPRDDRGKSRHQKRALEVLIELWPFGENKPEAFELIFATAPDGNAEME